MKRENLFFLLTVLFLGGKIAAAQTIVGLSPDGFVSMDLNTCKDTILNTNVSYNGTYMGFSTFDQKNHRYIWEAHIDSTGQDEIGVADAVTGKILNMYVIHNHLLSEIEYDEASQLLYGLGDSSFNQMDLTTGKISTIIKYSKIITCMDGVTCFDPVTETYFYQDEYNLDTCLLYMINAKTGKRSSVKIPNLGMLEYCVSTGKIYGINRFALASYDWNKKVYSVLNPYIGYYFSDGMSTFDENNKQYVILGSDSTHNNFIYKVNIITGVETKCNTPNNYFYNPEVYSADTSETSVEYEAVYGTKILDIYPNPSLSDPINASMEGFTPGCSIYLNVYNSEGFCIYSQAVIAPFAPTLRLPFTNAVNSGLYMITVTDGKLIKSGSFVRP